MLSQEEIDAAAGERWHLIELEEFVHAEEIDPVFHNREYLVAIRPRAEILTLHTLNFADELVKTSDLDLPPAPPGSRQARDRDGRQARGVTP
jgi:non-homologous end joining protein Ku